MNAGRDVEHLISSWLRDEAPERAPDRILDSAGRTVDRTKQRRVGAAWKEPTMTSSARLLAAAAVLIIAVAGAAWIGRSTAGVGGPSPSTSPTAATPTATIVTLESYRAARDAYCTPANARLIALNQQGDKLDPAASVTDRVAMIGVLQQIIALGADEVAHLAAIPAPAALADEHATDVVHHRDSGAVLSEALRLLQANKVTESNAVADATGPLSALEEAFEAKYELAGCP
jgi:hypothetical protein